MDKKATKSKSKTNSAKASKTKSASSQKKIPWTFPKNTLEDAISIPKAIEEKNAGNPMGATELAKAVGFRQANDWRFLDLLRSANLYGLVSGTGKTARVSLEGFGEDIVAPSSSGQRQKALVDAFLGVADFKKVADFYGNKKIPEDEYFANTIARELKIARDRVEAFSDIFRKNIEFVGAFDAASTVASEIVTIENTQVIESESSSMSPRVREFLDTCFVMMPFGEWYDRYYQEIYIPGIRDAGFEPVRADELFTTGTVVEQIWEQIQKATYCWQS